MFVIGVGLFSLVAVVAPVAPTADPSDRAALARDFMDPLSATDVVHQLKMYGLPILDFTTYDQSTNPDQVTAKTYVSKATFHDSRLVGTGDPSDGTVEVFANASDRDQRYNSLHSAAQSNAILQEYDIRAGDLVDCQAILDLDSSRRMRLV